MRVGFGRRRLDLPVPVAIQGSSSRVASVERIDERLSVTAALVEDTERRAVIVSADVLAHGPVFVDAARSRIARAVECPEDAVLIAATHTHASIWPGAPTLAGPSTRSQDGVEGSALMAAYVGAADDARSSARPVRACWGRSSVRGIATNRRERDGGQVIIGRDPDGAVDEGVTTVRFVAPDGSTVGSIVGFGCHPVVLGAAIPRANPDYVGPLRATAEAAMGGLCLFLQGASGDVQPVVSLVDEDGPEVLVGQRIGVEAVHSVIGLDPWPRHLERVIAARSTPTALYRSVLDDETPQVVAVQRSVIDLGFDAPEAIGGPSVSALEVWVLRIGDGAIVAFSAEPFASIAERIREAMPSASILVAGCAGPVIGYLPDEAAYAVGGFEVEAAHRVYGQPSAVARGSDRLAIDAATDLLRRVFL